MRSRANWYLAEGSTAWGYDCYITVQNPNSNAVTADITYMTTAGEVDGETVDLPAGSQTTVNPRDTLGEVDFYTYIKCNEGKTIAVDRTMSWPPQGSGAGVCSATIETPHQR